MNSGKLALITLIATAPKNPQPRKEYQEPWYLRAHDHAGFIVSAVAIAAAASAVLFHIFK
jgi:hypothetical protein